MLDTPGMADTDENAAQQKRDELRQFIEAHNLKVKPWAKKAHVSNGAVRNFLTGRSKTLTQATVNALAEAADVTADKIFPSLSQGSQPQRKGSPGDNNQSTVATKNNRALRLMPGDGVDTWPRDLKVLGFVKAGKVGYYPDNGETLEMTERPPMLAGVPESQCYAVYIDDESMVPALKPGYIAWVHVRRPAQPGDNIIIQLSDGQAFVKELVRRTERHLICKQWNPAEEVKYDQTKVTAVHLVVGTGKGIR